MKIQKFLTNLHEELELENIELTENTNLKELESYDSLSIMTIIAFVDDNFGIKLSAMQLASINTVESLMKLIGLDRFEE